MKEIDLFLSILLLQKRYFDKNKAILPQQVTHDPIEIVAKNYVKKKSKGLYVCLLTERLATKQIHNATKTSVLRTNQLEAPPSFASAIRAGCDIVQKEDGETLGVWTVNHLVTGNCVV